MAFSEQAVRFSQLSNVSVPIVSRAFSELAHEFL